MQTKKDLLQENIKQAALECFSKNGYENTKLSDISQEAGISVGNIYTYFKNKEQLYTTLFEDDFLITFKNNVIASFKSVFSFSDTSFLQSEHFWEKKQQFALYLYENRSATLLIAQDLSLKMGDNLIYVLTETLLTTLFQYFDATQNPDHVILLKKKRGLFNLNYKRFIYMILDLLTESTSKEQFTEDFTYSLHFLITGIHTITKTIIQNGENND